MTTPAIPPLPQIDPRRRDTEIIVAVFRTIFLLLVLSTRQFREAGMAGAFLLQAAVIAAACYNLVLFVLHIRNLAFPRFLIVTVDLILITLWIYLSGSGREHFFALYYAVVIVSGLWFGVRGAFVTALSASLLYVWAVLASQPARGGISAETVLLQMSLLIITAGVVSVAAQIRDRDSQWLARARADLTRFEQRIRTAQYVDELVRPKRLPAAPGLDIGFQYRPAASAFSGDYYDLIPLGGRRWGLCIADLSGQFSERIGYLHTFKTTLRITARREQSPARVLTEINREVAAAIADTVDLETFISMAYLVVDLDQATLTYSNGGHEPPVVIPGDGKAPVALEPTGLLLGVLSDVAYEEATLSIRAGDTLVLFTDGMTEVMDSRRRFLGREGLLAAVEQHVTAATARQMAADIFQQVMEFGRGGRRRDDMTLLIARITAPDLPDLLHYRVS